MKTVFTNGCFDILHPGHIELLERARELGERLVVGINSDRSVRSIKGPGRPVTMEDERKRILESLTVVDEVIIFDELTPEKLIHRIKPDVLVKGGDWGENEIIGAAFVKSLGGEVVTVPLNSGYSTTSLLQRMKSESVSKDDQGKQAGKSERVSASIIEHKEVFEALESELGSVEECAAILIRAVKKGRKILICGNGGSAADAQHMAAELVGRYERDRQALPAVALTTDTSALTAIANDFDFERVFSRQIEALAEPDDVLVAISTSGISANVIDAVMTARSKGCAVVGLTGASGKKLAALCDGCVKAPSERTSRVQEVHSWTIHIWCEMLEAESGA